MINLINIINDIRKKCADHFIFVLATIMNAGFHFIYSIFVRSKISPLEYGIYSTCLLLQTYMTYIQLGILNSFNRDYPQYIGAKDEINAKKCRDTTFSYLISIFVISSFVFSIIIYSIGKYLKTDMRYIIGLILCTIITTTTIIENFATSRVRVDYGFKYTSLVMILELISIVIGFFLVNYIGYYALYVTTILSMIIGISLYYKKVFKDLSFRIDKKMLKIMLLSGLPLLFNNLIWTIVNSIDKFVILGFINTEALGIYSIAQLVFSYMILIPNAMSQLFFVKLGKIYGESKSKDSLNVVAQDYTLIIAVVISFVVLAAYFFLEPVVKTIMPNYYEGIKAAKILLIGLAIYAPTMISSNVLTILRKNSALVRGSIYLCISNAVCSIAIVYILGPNIESVALGTAISYLIRTVILLFQLKKNANTRIKDMVKAAIIPVIILSGPGIIINYFMENYIIGFLLSILVSIIIIFLYYKKTIKKLIGMENL